MNAGTNTFAPNPGGSSRGSSRQTPEERELGENLRKMQLNDYFKRSRVSKTERKRGQKGAAHMAKYRCSRDEFTDKDRKRLWRPMTARQLYVNHRNEELVDEFLHNKSHGELTKISGQEWEEIRRGETPESLAKKQFFETQHDEDVQRTLVHNEAAKALRFEVIKDVAKDQDNDTTQSSSHAEDMLRSKLMGSYKPGSKFYDNVPRGPRADGRSQGRPQARSPGTRLGYSSVLLEPDSQGNRSNLPFKDMAEAASYHDFTVFERKPERTPSSQSVSPYGPRSSFNDNVPLGPDSQGNRSNRPFKDMAEAASYHDFTVFERKPERTPSSQSVSPYGPRSSFNDNVPLGPRSRKLHDDDEAKFQHDFQVFPETRSDFSAQLPPYSRSREPRWYDNVPRGSRAHDLYRPDDEERRKKEVFDRKLSPSGAHGYPKYYESLSQPSAADAAEEERKQKIFDRVMTDHRMYRTRLGPFTDEDRQKFLASEKEKEQEKMVH